MSDHIGYRRIGLVLEKKEVHCIWLPYGPPNRVGKHGYTYQIYPHISLGIFYDRFAIDFLIPDMAERYRGRYQSKFLTLILKLESHCFNY
jgi:hypothetical protein